MKNYSYNRKISDKLVVKGTLSEDGKTIRYIDDEKEYQTIAVEKCMANFIGEEIALSISLTEDRDLLGDIEE